MRLAALMHRTVADLRETMDAREWSRWLLFHELYDLPDAFLIAGQLGALVSQAVGGKGKPEDFAPYYRVDATVQPQGPQRPASDGNGVKPFFDFLSGYAKERAAQGKPIPRERRR